MKSVIADPSVWPKYEPPKPKPKRVYKPRQRRKPEEVFTGISYENQIKKLAQKLKGTI